jgi:broad specificity phosphatase PhoE
MTIVKFLRHFKTKVDKNIPVAEWDLDEEGKQEMAKLLETDPFSDITVIYSSPEPKAMITAKAIAAKYNIPIKECKNVIEVDRSKAGFIDGDYVEVVESFLTESEDFKYVWESIPQVEERARNFVKEVSEEEGNALIISHGLFLSITLSKCFNEERIKFWKNLKFGHILELDLKTLKDCWS